MGHRRAEPILLGDPGSAEQLAEVSSVAALALGTLGVLGLVGTALVTLGHRTPPGYHPLAIAVISATVVVTAGLGRRRRPLLSRTTLVYILPVAAVVLAIAAFLAGPVVSPVMTMVFLWYASTITYLPRRLALAMMAWAGVVYAVFLALQPGNSLPVARWEFTMGMMITTALQWNLLVERSWALARGEQAARAQAERARAELEVVSRQKSRFLARMSHELRTPLNAIIGFSEVLARRSFGDLNAKQSEYVGDVVDSGRHLLALVDDLLDLAKVETGTVELDVGEVELAGLLSGSLAMFKEQAGRQRITLGLEVDPDLPTIGADARKLKQVVFNLLANAVRFTPAGGRVILGAGRAGPRVRIWVSDTGPGIAAEDHEAIFEEFRQGGPRGGSQGGTGLGLPLARRLVELHGGSLGVESEPGQGSTFAAELPVRPPFDGVAEASMPVEERSERLVLGEPDSPQGRIETARLYILTGAPLIGTAVLAGIILHFDQPGGYHEMRFLALIPVGLAVVALAIARPQWLGAPGLLPYMTTFIITVGSLGFLAVGRVFGDFIALFYVAGVGSLVLLTRRQRITQLVVVGICYGVVLALQDSQAVPLVRWAMVMGFVVVTSVIFGRFVARIEALALAERAARGEAVEVGKQLALAGRHKTEFLANMSHELRTPLNVITGFSEVLAAQAFGPLNEKQAEYVDDVLSSGRHLLGLINDILDLAKADAGRMELQLAHVDPEATVANVFRPFREEAARRRIDLSLEAGAGAGLVEADEAKLAQALGNLVSNAVKFTPDGGRVVVRATRETDHVEISVTDTGRGIDPADQERIFDAFAQGGDSPGSGPGSGLGLALARRYAELHGGSLDVTSDLGTGATFTIRLPLNVGAAAPAEVA